MRIVQISLLALMIMAGIAAPAAAVTRQVCVFWISSLVSDCAKICSSPAFSDNNWMFVWGYSRPVPPATVMPPIPTTLTSCKSVWKNDRVRRCEVTMCGPETVSLRDVETKGDVVKRGPARATSNSASAPCGAARGDPCPQNSSGINGPGLLEGDTGFATQGPAAAGTAPTSRAPTGIPGKGP